MTTTEELLNTVINQQKNVSKQVMELTTTVDSFADRQASIESDISSIKKKVNEEFVTVEDGNGGIKISRNKFNRMLYSHVKTGGYCDQRHQKLVDTLDAENRVDTKIKRWEGRLHPWAKVIQYIGIIVVVVIGIVVVLRLDKLLDTTIR